MKIILAALASFLVGFLEAFGGFQATHSPWSYAVTIPLAMLTGFIIGRTAGEL